MFHIPQDVVHVLIIIALTPAQDPGQVIACAQRQDSHVGRILRQVGDVYISHFITTYFICHFIIISISLLFSALHHRHKIAWHHSYSVHYIIINPRRACARVTVLVLSVCLSVCLCVCVCVCVCVFPILAPRAIRRTNSSISDFSAIRA